MVGQDLSGHSSRSSELSERCVSNQAGIINNSIAMQSPYIGHRSRVQFVEPRSNGAESIVIGDEERSNKVARLIHIRKGGGCNGLSESSEIFALGWSEEGKQRGVSLWAIDAA